MCRHDTLTEAHEASVIRSPLENPDQLVEGKPGKYFPLQLLFEDLLEAIRGQIDSASVMTRPGQFQQKRILAGVQFRQLPVKDHRFIEAPGVHAFFGEGLIAFCFFVPVH